MIDASNRRWVEYADHFQTWIPLTDRIPPKWSGWLSHVYDDVPGHGNFVEHFFIKEWEGGHRTGTPLAHCPPGNINPFNEGRVAFL